MGKYGLLIVMALLLAGCASVPATPDKKPVVHYQLPEQPPAILPYVLTADQHVVVCFCTDLEQYATASYREAARRFNNPLVVLGHGGTDKTTGKWTMYPTASKFGKMLVQDVANELAKRFPDRDIVFFTCNRDHHRLTTPRVWYFTEIVWCLPDEDSKLLESRKSPIDLFVYKLFTNRENERGVGCAGSIWEAVTQNTNWR